MTAEGGVLVLAEHKNGELDGITLQLLSKGRQLADTLGMPLEVLVLGNKPESVTRTLLNGVADVLLLAEHPLLDPYNPEVYCSVVADLVKNSNPRVFLIGHTFLGMEIGPAISAKLGINAFTNCVDVESSDGILTVTRPFFNGTVHAKLQIEGPGPHMVSLQKGGLPKRSVSGRTTKVVTVPVQIDQNSLRTRVIGYVEASTAGIDVTKADIVVAVGRGIGGKANIKLVEDLAKAMGGVVACSRPVADLGWLPQEHLVGMSGRTVKPRVYLACGLSGASQHVAGMIESQLIIAINKDRSAPIFQVAHCGVVEDLFKIVGHISVK